jgi:hypothetical protein
MGPRKREDVTSLATAISNPLQGISYHSGESLVSRVWSSIAGVIKLDVSEDRVVADRQISLPAWVIPACVQLFVLQKLPENWDSYGGVALQARHRDAALRFLGLVMSDDIPMPDIVPLADGGVQLEWRQPGAEIDFISDDEVTEPTLFIARNSEIQQLHETRAVSYFLDELRSVLRTQEAIGA